MAEPRCDLTELPAAMCGCPGHRAAEPAIQTGRPATGRDLGPWFTASYSSDCADCGGAIEPGDRIRADGAGGWLCHDCGEVDDDLLLAWIPGSGSQSAVIELGGHQIGAPAPAHRQGADDAVFAELLDHPGQQGARDGEGNFLDAVVGDHGVLVSGHDKSVNQHHTFKSCQTYKNGEMMMTATPPPPSQQEGGTTVPNAFVDLPADLAGWVEILRMIKNRRAELDELEKTARDKICPLLGDAVEGRLGGRPVVTWIHTAAPQRFNKKQLAKDHPDLVKKYTTYGEPGRRFELVIPATDAADQGINQ